MSHRFCQRFLIVEFDIYKNVNIGRWFYLIGGVRGVGQAVSANASIDIDKHAVSFNTY